MTSDPDKVTQEKTIYQVSYSEVFWRNFVAGVARALGGLIFQILFLVIVANLFMAYAWPYVQPVLTTLSTVSESLQSLQQQTEKPFFEWK